MDDTRCELLRRRLVLYRCYLREGCLAPQAALYLKQIRLDEAELTAIANEGHPTADSDRREKSASGGG